MKAIAAVGLLLALIGAIFGYYFYEIGNYNKLRKSIYPCPHIQLKQHDNSIKIFCPTGKKASFEVKSDSERKKIYVIWREGEQSMDGPIYLNLPKGTSGYALCYKNSYGEYCPETIQ